LGLLGLCVNANATISTNTQCGYVCNVETTYQEIRTLVYKKVIHNDDKSFEDMINSLPPPSAGPGSKFLQNNIPKHNELHDCKNYQDWDKLSQEIASGVDNGYKMINNKLFTNSGKRYLRCNDPDNVFSKYIQKYPDLVDKRPEK